MLRPRGGEKIKTNIYDELRKSWKHPTDEQITAIIKRHMANLLYPVDLASFAGPDKDAKFHSQIVELQKEMDVPTTGVLTSASVLLIGTSGREH